MFFGRSVRENFQDPLDEILHFHRLGNDEDAAGFEIGQGKQILGQAPESFGVALDDLEKTHGVLRIGGRRLQESFDITLDRRQRRAQFVRDVGDKVGADGFQTLEIGDVVEHQQES